MASRSGSALVLLALVGSPGDPAASTSRPPQSPASLLAADCNGNGVPDPVETLPRFTSVVLDREADGARWVSAADLDGDGDLDVIAALENDDALVWYANLGDGSFGPRRTVNHAANGASAGLALDLDGDGDLDLIGLAKYYPNFGMWYENVNGHGNFSPPHPLDLSATMFNARAVAAGDFDGDGDADPVTAAFAFNTVAWYENAGGPVMFLSKSTVATVGDPNTVWAGDLDGDGDADIVTASQSTGSVAWHRNSDGQGSFVPGQTIELAAHAARSVRGTDLDGDGDPDVLVASWRDSTVAWYENLDGLGNFGPARVVSDATAAHAAIGVDLDRDGDRDVVVAEATGTKGAGSVGDCCAAKAGPWCSDQECAQDVCDFDGFCCNVQWDYICAGEAKMSPDCSVACGGGTGRLVWFENADGHGTFSAGQQIARIKGALDVFAADLDGDADEDLISADYVEGRVTWHVNQLQDCNGNEVPDDCDIASGVEADADCDRIPDSCDLDGGAGKDCNANGVADACDVADAASADCSRNGVPDECEADCNGDGYADSCHPPSGIVDVDGDGVPDVCEADCNGNGVPDDWDIAFGVEADCDANGVADGCQADCDGNGVADACDTDVAFAKHTVAVGDLNTESEVDLFLTDIDGDADLDILIASFSYRQGQVGWYENLDGRGAFGPFLPITTTEPKPAVVVGADVDGDGDVDVVLSTSGSDRMVAWYENTDGLRVFGSKRLISETTGSGMGVGDLDGDGDPDVTAQQGSGAPQIRLHRNSNGDGQAWSNEPGVEAVVLASRHWVADVDSDGNHDLCYGGATTGWARNLDGEGTLGPGQSLVPADVAPTQGASRAGFVADLDADGDPDFLVASYWGVYWYENTGLGFGLPRPVATEFNVESVAAADLDRDGDLDVVFGSQGLFYPGELGQVAWVENLGAGVFAAERSLTDGLPYTAEAQPGDLDGDGDLDVVAILDQLGPDELVWYENLSDDCNGNGSPDICEPDCDGDGLIDACALSLGIQTDCNGNLVPDACESGVVCR